jgi:hypothetical protein
VDSLPSMANGRGEGDAWLKLFNEINPWTSLVQEMAATFA